MLGEKPMKRYGLVRGLRISVERVAAHLPSNYKVIGMVDDAVIIEGEDNHGWTFDRYVAPRLGSGLLACQEIDLSHPIMKELS
jgi:hypothetical protein